MNKNLNRNLKLTWELTKGTRKYLVLSFILILFLVIFSSIIPALGARQIMHINSNSWEKLFYVSLGLFIFEILGNIFRYIY